MTSTQKLQPTSSVLPAGVRAYLRALLRNWWARITGPVVTIGIVITRIAGWELSTLGWVVLGAVVLLPAGYFTWRKERRRVTELTARVQLSVHLRGEQDSRVKTQHERFYLEVTNEGSNLARSVRVVLKPISPPPRQRGYLGRRQEYLGPTIGETIAASALLTPASKDLVVGETGTFPLLDAVAPTTTTSLQFLVNGLDGYDAGSGGIVLHRTTILEPDEEWHLSLTVYAENADPRDIEIVVKLEDWKVVATMLLQSVTLPESSVSRNAALSSKASAESPAKSTPRFVLSDQDKKLIQDFLTFWDIHGRSAVRGLTRLYDDVLAQFRGKQYVAALLKPYGRALGQSFAEIEEVWNRALARDPRMGIVEVRERFNRMLIAYFDAIRWVVKTATNEDTDLQDQHLTQKRRAWSELHLSFRQQLNILDTIPEHHGTFPRDIEFSEDHYLVDFGPSEHDEKLKLLEAEINSLKGHNKILSEVASTAVGQLYGLGTGKAKLTLTMPTSLPTSDTEAP